MPMGKGRWEGRWKAKVRWKRDAERGRAARETSITDAAVTSAPHSFSIMGECVCVEPQSCHSMKIHCQTLLLPFVYARCETALRPFMKIAVSKPNLRHDNSSQNKATGKGLLQAGRAALASNYLGAKMCAFVCNEKQARFLLCLYRSKFTSVYQGSGCVYAGIGSLDAQHISMERQIKCIWTNTIYTDKEEMCPLLQHERKQALVWRDLQQSKKHTKPA